MDQVFHVVQGDARFTNVGEDLFEGTILEPVERVCRTEGGGWVSRWVAVQLEMELGNEPAVFCLGSVEHWSIRDLVPMLIMLIILHRGPGESAKEPSGFGELFFNIVVNSLGDGLRGLHYGTAKVLHLDIGTIGGGAGSRSVIGQDLVEYRLDIGTEFAVDGRNRSGSGGGHGGARWSVIGHNKM